MKKRILSMLLAIVMVVTLLPTVAFAEGTSNQAQWGVAQGTSAPATWEGSGTLAEALTYAERLTDGTAYIQLLNSVKTESYVDIKTGMSAVLDLNGHDIDRGLTGMQISGFVIYTKGNLTLCDTSAEGQGKITGGYANSSTFGSGVYVYNGGSFTMLSGNITGNTAYQNGGSGVRVDNGATFTMYGGNIYGNTCTYTGGTVNVCGTMYLYGGNIYDNSAYYAAGIYVMEGGRLEMSGGTVGSSDPAKGNVATSGGTCGVSTNGVFTMTGGSIINNTGVGVYVGSNGTFNVSGTVNISGNKMDAAECNIKLAEDKTITVAGPLNCTTPIGVVGKKDQVITSGWRTYMGAADLDAYFESDTSNLYLDVNTNGEVFFTETQPPVKYTVTAADAVADKITLSHTKAAKDTTVTVSSALTDPNIVLTSVICTADDGTEVATTANNGGFEFSMPEYDVTVTATFETLYPVWVGDAQFTGTNLVIDGEDVTGITGSATFNPESNTLTLNNFSYSGAGYCGLIYGDTIEAVIYSDTSLNILLDGNSVITHENSNYASYSCGIFANGNITIADAEGGAVGTLQATGGNNARDTSGGIYAKNSITINSGIITCKGGGTSDISGGIFADDNIYINGGEVNVSGEDANSQSYGMAACHSVYISDGHVLATAGTAEWNCLGIWGAFEGESVSGGIVYASGSNGGFCYATVSGGQITATGNTAAFQAGCEIDSNFTACVYAGNDEDGATEVTNPTADTYANKYVKIVPAYPVWVGGEQFTSEKLTINGTTGTATFNPESKTLTLNNFSHTSEGYEFSQFMGSASIHATLEHLIVNFVGSNTVASSAQSGYALYNYGALTITTDDSNGSLALTSDGDGIWVSGNLIINGCQVNATGITSNGTIAITNSFVTTNGARHGIAVVHAKEGVATEMKSDDLTITNSTVVATGGEYALFYDGGHNEEDESSICGGLIPKLVFDNKYAAVAGSDAESAVMAAAAAAATYENKHVRIVSVHDVTYKVDDEVVKTLTVEHGKDATAPEIPAKTGYTAVWSADGKNITADTEINAVYTINQYTVTYKADGVVVDTVEVEHGKDATAPEIPGKEGYNETAPKWDKDGKNITADTEINAVYTKNQPGEYADVTPDTNVGGGRVAEEIEKLKEKVPFTQEEEKQIEYGADVEVWLEIKDISDSVSSEEKAKVEEKLGDADVALYLDIAMFKQVGENEASRLTQLSDKVQITFKLDDSYINTDKDVTRTYSIIHIHNGKAEVITPVFDAATKTLTFETDRFSTYAVVYTDVENVPPTEETVPPTEKPTPPAEIPATGDSFQPAFWIACMTLSIFGIAVLLLDAKRKYAR